MTQYVGGLSSRPRSDEGPLWFDDHFIGFGEDGPTDRLIAAQDVTTVIVEKAGRQMNFWPAWLLTRTFGVFGFLASRQKLPTTVVTVGLATGETALFHLRSFKVNAAIRLLSPWLDAKGLPTKTVA